MKHIKLKISLEQFKSRLPSIIPAYHNDLLWTYDNTNINKSNYNMLPCSILWHNKVVSYNRFVSMYHFVNKYIKILTNTTCNTTYNSAIEMFNKNSNKLDKNECIELDKTIASICGVTEGTLNNALVVLSEMSVYFPSLNLNSEIYDTLDVDGIYITSMSNWQYNWGTTKLNVSEVQYWHSWFRDNASFSINKDCQKISNCCDCIKYHQLGGEKMYMALDAFLKNISHNIKWYEPFALIRLNLSTKIDNLGEFSIFAEQFNLGENYQNESKTGGAVIEYNFNDWELLPSSEDNELTGYKYSNTYKELYFGNVDGMTQYEYENYNDTTFGKNIVTPIPNAYKRRIDSFIPPIPSTAHISFTYNNNGNIVFNPIPIDLATKIDINTNNNHGILVIGGIEYLPFKMNYILYKSNFFKVNTDSNNNPYTKINNIDYYALYNCESGYIFNINGDKIPFNEKMQDYFIYIDGEYLIITNNHVIYKGVDYECIYGKGLFNNKTVYINNMRTVDIQGNKYIETNRILGNYLINNIDETSHGYTISDNTIFYYKPYTVFYTNYIVGETESKISSFTPSTNVAYDDIGNRLPGQFIKKPLQTNNNDIIEYTYSNPTENSWLDLYYQPGTLIHPSIISKTENKTTYWGNFLSDMEFYFMDDNGNKHFQVTLTHNDVILKKITALDAINKCLELKNDSIGTGLNVISKYGSLSCLKCDIIYYMGCNIERLYEKNNDGLFIYDKGYNVISNTGVKYIDTVDLIPQRCTYYMSNTQCYNLNYYELIWDKMINNTRISTFYVYKPQKISDNGFVYFPILREEYKIGTAMAPKVTSDVKINRGTARSFDKHIKLLEVKSLEALEQYNNGWMTIK